MLLRSSSTPFLNAWTPPHHSNSSLENDHLNFTTSFPSLTNHHHHSKPATLKTTPLQGLFSNSGIDEAVKLANEEDDLGLVADSGGDGGGRSCGGGGGGMNGGDGIGGGSGFDDDYDNNYNSSNYDNNGINGERIEAYYQKMIQADPRNPLLLGNYARFLVEVLGDLNKGEEYCGRAILGNPNDANMLTLYGDIIWRTQRNAHRAETYFDQAVKTAPDDCYVLASYAKFLWDVEEEEEEEEEEEGKSRDKIGGINRLPNFWEGMSPRHHTPLTAT